MSTAVAKRSYTPEEYLALPDFERYELIDGRLIERRLDLRANWAIIKLSRFLDEHVERNDLGWVFASECIYRCFAEPKKFRKADVSFIRRDRTAPKMLDVNYVAIAPDLAVEVASPNDRFSYVEEKVQEYLDAGVKLVWVVIPERRSARIHRADGSISGLKEADELSGEDVVPGFRCPLAAVFPPRVQS